MPASEVRLTILPEPRSRIPGLGLEHPDRAEEVGLELGPRGFERRLLDGSDREGARVVHQDIDAPGYVHHHPDAAAHALVGADVHREHVNRAMITGGRAGGAEHHQAVLGEPFRDGLADSAGRAGYQGRHDFSLFHECLPFGIRWVRDLPDSHYMTA